MNKVIKLSTEMLINKAVFRSINKDIQNEVQRAKRNRLAQEARLERMRSKSQAIFAEIDALIKANN